MQRSPEGDRQVRRALDLLGVRRGHQLLRELAHQLAEGEPLAVHHQPQPRVGAEGAEVGLQASAHPRDFPAAFAQVEGSGVRVGHQRAAAPDRRQGEPVLAHGAGLHVDVQQADIRRPAAVVVLQFAADRAGANVHRVARRLAQFGGDGHRFEADAGAPEAGVGQRAVEREHAPPGRLRGDGHVQLKAGPLDHRVHVRDDDGAVGLPEHGAVDAHAAAVGEPIPQGGHLGAAEAAVQEHGELEEAVHLGLQPVRQIADVGAGVVVIARRRGAFGEIAQPHVQVRDGHLFDGGQAPAEGRRAEPGRRAADPEPHRGALVHHAGDPEELHLARRQDLRGADPAVRLQRIRQPRRDLVGDPLTSALQPRRDRQRRHSQEHGEDSCDLGEGAFHASLPIRLR